MALGDVPGGGPGALARLVVGVGVDGQQAERHEDPHGSGSSGARTRRPRAWGQRTAGRELPWDQDNHPGSPQLSEPLHPTVTAPTAAPGTVASLDDRYGRTPDRRRRSRLVGIVAAIAVVLVFVAWVVWAGLDQESHGLDNTELGYTVVSDHQTVVHSQVSADPGTEVRCAVQVLDRSYSIVGWKEVTLPASDQRTRSISTSVNTTTRGVTGLIHDCWVP
ncbi:DUF4307 domain-containing protein [Curtobacterium sp. SGAir0471]|uniref:DUF4307 domain-containing protein n=1 Tax=Curtobacterium sp. SGAir0471 TaxID=2070337 RepID=UPI0034A0BE7F